MKAATSERDGAAVVIGVGQYLRDEQVWPLRYAADDAESMAGVLVDPEICGFPESNVKLLTDASATRDSVAHHLSKWLPEQCRGAQLAVIYFAGHGMIHKIGQREEGYLLPFDADPEDIATRGLLMTDLARWIDAIDAATVIICLDCCHAAKVISRAIASPEPTGRDMRIRPTMLQALTGRGRYLIASCEDGQVSLESESWGHGLFTYHLLDGIRARAIATVMAGSVSPSCLSTWPRPSSATPGRWAGRSGRGVVPSDRGVSRCRLARGLGRWRCRFRLRERSMRFARRLPSRRRTSESRPRWA